MDLQTNTFEKRSVITTTLDRMLQFHQEPEALKKLTPPPIFVSLRNDNRRSLTEGDLAFTLWFGPFPVRWTAMHSPGSNEYSFVDEMTDGPMAYWHHEHIIEPLDKGVALIDRVTYAHHPGMRGWITRLMFDGLPLRLLFFYRHLRTRIETTK